MAEFDLHIKGGTVVDGTRVPRYRADVWIQDGKIAQVGGRAPGFAKKTIDAGGMIVAPGFVDLHTHYDAQIRWDRTAPSRGGTASRRWCSAIAASVSYRSSRNFASARCSR